MVSCRILGHRFRFAADGRDDALDCERGCGVEGAKEYATPPTRPAYAAAFDREDRADLGRRAPFLGMFPLRMWRPLRRRHEADAARRGAEDPLSRHSSASLSGESIRT